MSKQTDLLNLTDAISVDGSNNVGIGTSNVGYVDANRNTLQVNGPTSSIIALAYGGTNAGYMYADSNTTQLWSEGSREFNMGTAAAGPITFKTNNTERMRIDAAGRVTMPYQPGFRASLLVGTPTAYIAGARVLNFTDVVHNIGGHYDGTNKFTAPVAGLYRFSCDRALNTQGQDQVIRHPEMSFFVNGASAHSVNTAVSVTNAVTASGYTHFVVNMGTELYLNANDYVQVQFNYTNSPSVLYEYARSYFSGYLIG